LFFQKQHGSLQNKNKLVAKRETMKMGWPGGLALVKTGNRGTDSGRAGTIQGILKADKGVEPRFQRAEAPAGHQVAGFTTQREREDGPGRDPFHENCRIIQQG
jgi:hypothetical protein